jgi:hypothetical protein
MEICFRGNHLVTEISSMEIRPGHISLWKSASGNTQFWKSVAHKIQLLTLAE